MTKTDTFELTIRNARIVTATDDFSGDIGITAGRVTAVADRLPAGAQDIDAQGRIVTPGGIDAHCHVEQISSMGAECADDWYSATVSAVHGGTTCILPFAVQFKGDSLAERAQDYERRAAEKAVIDYSYHLVIADPTPQALQHDLPALIRQGITSFKVFMTYETLKLNDTQLLDVFSVAAREGALPMVHAENNDVILWIARHLISKGYVAPKYHAVAHDSAAEDEATHRAIQLASVLGVPVFIVHVSSPGAAQAIRSAQALGAQVHGETCPQYLFLTADDLDLPDVQGAKFCCSPPPRDAASQEMMWRAMQSGVLQLFSSDHAPFRFDASGKIPHGKDTRFNQMANGVPGLELRLPLLFSEGVGKGRLTLNQFVALTSTNAARMYGLYPRKGTIAPGSDADLVIWDAQREVRITADLLHDGTGYSPYEGMTLTGWPQTVISRGRIAVAEGALKVGRGSGEMIRRGKPAPLSAPAVVRKESRFIRGLLDID